MAKEKEHKSSEKKLDKKTKKLHERIDSLEKEKFELFEKLQRISADYANYQKRAPKQIADSVAYKTEAILKSFLPALDNFEHTLAAEQSTDNADNMEAFVKGVRIVYEQLLTIMKTHGVEQVDALGQKFDPAMHQAMMQKTEPEQQDGIVLEEFQKGYKLNDRIIRPAKVIVNARAAEQEEEESTE